MSESHEMPLKPESNPESSLSAEPKKSTGTYTLSWLIFVGCLIATLLLGMLIVSIMERRWETVQPQFVAQPLDQWETDNAVWGRNYPREYETFLKTKTPDTKTAFGGSYLRDYLKRYPNQVVLFAGMPFSREFKQARGHEWALHSVTTTLRTTTKDGQDTGMPATCWTCKSSTVPKLMNSMGVVGFYNSSFKELKPKVKTTIGCLDCHDPKTMNLRISRPALREAFARQGRDIDKATHQEMRSLVCAQCHVEYYFGNNPDQNKAGKPSFDQRGKYLVFPWDRGTTVDAMEEYFAERPDLYDWIHPISGTRMIKMQHPDWELYRTGIHAYRGVSCADCHMPYVTQGGVKFTDHHIQSPLLNISSSCSVCHRWSEQEVRERVTAIQTKHYKLKLKTEDILVFAHFDVAACKEAGASEEHLNALRNLLWRAQLRWDYVSANNGMGFHSPQESARILGDAIAQAQEVRLMAARLLAQMGIKNIPKYPDVSTQDKAFALIQKFEDAAKDPQIKPPSLFQATAN
jgi:nitrite reductase (cytochrome c-552)